MKAFFGGIVEGFPKTFLGHLPDFVKDQADAIPSKLVSGGGGNAGRTGTPDQRSVSEP